LKFHKVLSMLGPALLGEALGMALAQDAEAVGPDDDGDALGPVADGSDGRPEEGALLKLGSPEGRRATTRMGIKYE
jgi:hypothetical protein